jgi:hypothetical protein
MAANALYERFSAVADRTKLAVKWPNDAMYCCCLAARLQAFCWKAYGRRRGWTWLAVGVGKVNLGGAEGVTDAAFQRHWRPMESA